MKVLVTGGAGYIGAITASALELAGHTPVILGSLVTESVTRSYEHYRDNVAQSLELFDDLRRLDGREHVLGYP